MRALLLLFLIPSTLLAQDWNMMDVVPVVKGKYEPWLGNETKRQDYHNAICKVELSDLTGATGYVVNNTYVITCSHVVAKHRTAKCRFLTKQVISAVVVHNDATADLAVLRLRNVAPASLKVAKRMPRIGTPLEVCGYPYFDPMRLMHWKSPVIGVTLYRKTDPLYLRGAVVSGQSGGPILNENHEVVGMVLGGHLQKWVPMPKTRDGKVLLNYPIRAGNYTQLPRYVR